MSGEKEKNDIVGIILLTRLHDYSDRETLFQIIRLQEEHKVFHTVFGEKYIERLKAIYDEKPHSSECVLCGRHTAWNDVVCDECIKQLSPIVGKNPKIKKPEQKDKTQFCRNCGRKLDKEEYVCIFCGAPRGYGFNYCSCCGTEMTMQMETETSDFLDDWGRGIHERKREEKGLLKKIWRSLR